MHLHLVSDQHRVICHCRYYNNRYPTFQDRVVDGRPWAQLHFAKLIIPVKSLLQLIDYHIRYCLSPVDRGGSQRYF